MDSLVVDTVIGIVFVFAVFALAVSFCVEALTRVAGLRAEFLLRGVSSLLDADTKFDGNWLPRVVKNAQNLATEAPIVAALDEIGSNPAGVFASAQVTQALTDAHLFVTPPDPATPATEESTAAALTTARASIASADDAFTAERAAVDQLAATDPGREARAAALAKARELLLPAQQAVKDVPAAKNAVTVVSVMTQPMVDLTAALKIPEGMATLTSSLDWGTKRKLPSYLSSRTFSRALVRTLVPDPASGRTTVDELREAIDRVPNDDLKRVLKGHLDIVDLNVDTFRKEIETWYDDHMDRVSGWYKRHTRWYVLAVATVLALAFNVNAIAMGRAFYTDQALRDSVVSLAFENSKCDAEKSDVKPEECLEDVRGQIDDLRGLGLPLGWGTVVACQADTGVACNWLESRGLAEPGKTVAWSLGHLAVLLLGWAVIALSALLGARFWFDLLTKVGSIRSAGQKPATST